MKTRNYHLRRRLAMIKLHFLRAFSGILMLLILSSTAAGVEDACRWEGADQIAAPVKETVIASGDRDTYSGTIHVFVTEIEGRWEDADDQIFPYAFLSFALQEPFSLGENDSLTWEVQWDGNLYGFGNVQESNLKVVAAVFNAASYTNYSDPPSGAPFAVHEIDACAAATCGTTGYNVAPTGFTHTVLVQEGATST